MRCHDFHLTAYEARQLGAEIVLHLADDWRPNPTEESHIRFSDVELHHFTHTGGTIIFGIEEVPLSQILDEHWERITRWAPQYGGVPHWDRDIATATSGSLRQPDTKLGTLVHPSDSPASLSPNLLKMLQTNSPKPPDPYEGFALFLWSVASCARGTYAQRAIGKAQEIFYENLKGKLPPNQEAKVYYFSLAPAEVPLPLGWMLSNRAARAVGLNRLAPESFFVDADDCGKRPTGSLGRRNRR